MPVWLLTALLTAPASAPAQDPAVAYRRALFDFAQGDYRAVVDRLAPLLDPVQLSGEEDVAEARKTLGAVYFLLNQQGKAREQFELLILMQPHAQLDPYATAPPVLRFFAEVRESVGKKGLEMQRVFTQRRESFEAPRYIERQSIRHIEALCYLPFGIGQFQNGDVGLGVMFLAFDLVALGANVLGYIMLQMTADEQGLLRNVNGADRTYAERTKVTWNAVQYSGLGAFAVGWIAGAIHARWFFQPVVNVERDLLPAASQPSVTLGLKLGAQF